MSAEVILLAEDSVAPFLLILFAMSPPHPSQPEEDNRPGKDWFLEKETELRLEVDNENPVDIQVSLPTYVV